MSEFTTKVRFICETFAGLDESGGFNDIETTIESSHDKIFGNFPIFDENFRATLQKEILYQYYDREICCDTVAEWQYFITKRLRKIMPLYNQYYESELLLKGVNLLNDVNVTTERDVDKTNTSVTDVEGKTTATIDNTTTEDSNTNQDFNTNSTITQNKNTTTTDTINNLHWDVFSDTPQGTVSDLDNGTYMSNARKLTDVNTNTRVNSGNDTDETTGNGNNTAETETESHITGTSVADVKNNSTKNDNGVEKYIEKIAGVRNGTYPEKVIALRKSFVNITAMIVDELADCFYQFY